MGEDAVVKRISELNREVSRGLRNQLQADISKLIIGYYEVTGLRVTDLAVDSGVTHSLRNLAPIVIATVEL